MRGHVVPHQHKKGHHGTFPRIPVMHRCHPGFNRQSHQPQSAQPRDQQIDRYVIVSNQFYTKNAISPQQQKQTESRRPLASQLPKMRSNSSCPTAALSWSERLRERHRSARCFTMARLQNANISHRTLCTPMATTPPSADTAPRAPNTDCFLGAGVILNRALTSNHHPPPLHL